MKNKIAELLRRFAHRLSPLAPSILVPPESDGIPEHLTKYVPLQAEVLAIHDKPSQNKERLMSALAVALCNSLEVERFIYYNTKPQHTLIGIKVYFRQYDAT